MGFRPNATARRVGCRHLVSSVQDVLAAMQIESGTDDIIERFSKSFLEGGFI